MSTLVSQLSLATHLGCLPPAVAKYTALGVIDKNSAGKFDETVCRLKVLAYLRELAAGRSGKSCKPMVGSSKMNQMIAVVRRKKFE